MLMVGTQRGLEARVVPEAGFPLLTIPVAGLKGKSLLTAARNASMLPRALVASLGHLRRHRPATVIGVGGYASGPMVAAAALRRTPTLIHEQNLIPGTTNRWLAPHASQVAVTFEATREHLKGRGIVTGNPVRAEFAGVKPRPRNRGTRHLLIFGGSQGAAAINRAMREALPGLAAIRDRLRILHQTGKDDGEAVRRAYGEAGFQAEVRPFIRDMWRAVEDADLVLARAGATTVAELTAAGRGSVLVPLPHAIHDHQTFNARTLEDSGASVLVPQRDLDGPSLAKLLAEILSDEERLATMASAARGLGRPDAASRIAELAAELVAGAAPAGEREART